MTRPALKKIMIVDDEQMILTSLAYVLKTEGVEVIACNEIEQAEAALAATHFDLVIADIRMSGVNGIEGLELLSYIRDRFDSRVIVITGYVSNDTRDEAYRRGAHYYFQKPVDIPELLKQVSLAGIPVRNS
jgi:DNA-binding NtrC family response regulator